MSNLGAQRVRTIVRASAFTYQELADLIGPPCSERHLRCAFGGWVRPMPAVRHKLPVILGVPLDELFNEEALARPYAANKNPWKPVTR